MASLHRARMAGLAVLLLCLCGGADAKNNSQTIYIDINNGAETNPGTQEAPFRTIEQAKSRTRELITDGMSGDIKIVIRQGTYYLAAPLVFDQRDSGRNGFKVIYCAADGEKVRIVGGKAVTGWRPYKGSICKADIGKGRVFYALFENDTWSTLACSPNTGFFTADGGSTTPKGSSLIYRQEDIKVPIDTSHARVYIWAGFNEQWYGGMNYNWWSSLLPVTDANWASRTLTLAGQSYYNIHKQNRYRIEGSLDLLDSPGEWYLDDANGIVYYWPRSVPIEKQEIIAPTCEQVLCFEGADQQHPAENITFEGVTLSVSDSIQKYFVDVEVMRAGLVLLNNARGITIRNCVIRNAGYNGIYATKFSQNHSFTGNLIEGCGYVCINLSSYAVNDLTVKSPDRLYVNKNNLISNNYLRRGGLVLGHGMGMLIFESGDNTISNNLVEDMPRYGILLLGKTTYANMMITGELYGQKITWDNHSDFICARNNKIVFNEVRDAMKDSQDAGAIGAWGLGRDNVIANNIVHDVHGKVVEGATMGIYLDDASHYTKVLNNIVYDIYGTKDTWAYCLKGVDIEFANNIAYNASETASVLVLQTDLAAVAETPVGVKYERVDNVVLKNNIFCQHGGNDIYSISPWKPTIIRESNFNVFYHPGGKYSQLVDSKRSTLDEWRMRDGREFDANSITADPLFVDAENGDFALRDNSPVRKLGFKQIDQSQIGLKKDFKFKAMVKGLVHEKKARMTYYVSVTDGNDGNCGSIDTPLKTLYKARQLVRDAIANGMFRDVVVYVRGGKYYLDKSLVFDESDSGRDGYQVVYKNYNSEVVEIVGGTPVSGWTKDAGNVYKAAVGKGRDFNALFENGRWATLARSPNTGYHRVKARINDPCSVTFVYDANSVPAFDHENANVVIWAGSASFTGDEANYDWYTSTVPIAKADAAQHTITLKDQTWWKVSPHNRYYIQGAKALIDSPGEWYYDSREGVLYYWPLTIPIDKQEVIIPCAANVIVCSGSSMAKPVSGITFEGLTFRNSDFCNWFGPGCDSTCKGFIYITNARNISVINCHIRNAGYNGIAMPNYSKNNIVRDCVIEGCGVNGISVSGYELGVGPFSDCNEAYVNYGHLIRNNHIRSCGKLVGQGSGILLYQAGDMEIANNLIEDMPRYGINMIGMSYSYLLNPRDHSGYGGELYGQKVTWDNRMQFLYCRDIRIVRNEFRDLMKDSQDGGAITAWAAGANNRIEENFIHDITPALPKGSYVGVYLDDASSYFTIRKNVITRLGSSLDVSIYPLQIKGLFNTVTNNIIVNNKATAGALVIKAGLAGNPDSPKGIEDEKVGRLIFTKNVFYNNKGRELYRIYPWQNDVIETSDDNIIYDANGVCGVTIDWKLESWDVWKKRLDGKYDAHSVIEDPCMMDPAADNYIFKEHSPARRLGIEDVNLANVGLLKKR